MSASDQTLRRRDARLTLSHAEAIAAVLVGSVAVDGVLRAEEAGRLNEILSSTRWTTGTSIEAAAGLTTRALALIADHGLAAVLAACAPAIPADLRATTFALATDLALSDGRLASRENTLIDQLQHALQIEGDLARKIVEVLLIKNRASGRPDL